jgi:hypothetical protein
MLLVELVFERPALLAKLPAPVAQFLQADHVRLIGIK